MLRIFLGIAFLMLTVSVNAEIYKWVDGQGKVHFGDQRPANAKVEKVKVSVNSYEHVSYELPPLSTQSASESPRAVVMYSATWCGYCKKAKAYFEANNIPYTDYDVENSEEGKTKYAAIGGQGVPIIFVGQARMNGFSPEGFAHLYGKN